MTVARGLVARLDGALVGASAVIVASALGLKYWLRDAGADALSFLLAPSCALANRFGTLGLVHEVGAGYITHQPPMIVGPSCAGTNFLVIAWLAAFAALQVRSARLEGKLVLGGVAFGVAYLATVVTNAARIALAAELFVRDLSALSLSHAEAHRLLGVGLYVATLVLLDRSLRRTGAPRPRASWTRGTPLGIYLGVALVVPAASGAMVRDPSGFLVHAAWTTCAALAVHAAIRAVDAVVSARETG